MCHRMTYGWTRSAMQFSTIALRWRHNGCNSVSNHQPRECLLRRLIRRTSKKTSKLRVTGLCAGNSPETGEFPAQMASIGESASIWWRHHGKWCMISCQLFFITNVLCATEPPTSHIIGWSVLFGSAGKNRRNYLISCWSKAGRCSSLGRIQSPDDS